MDGCNICNIYSDVGHVCVYLRLKAYALPSDKGSTPTHLHMSCACSLRLWPHHPVQALLSVPCTASVKTACTVRFMTGAT
jgi:hypothetical protein